MKNKKYIFVYTAVIGFIIGLCTFYIFSPINKNGTDQFIYIDKDDNIDSLSVKMTPYAHGFIVTELTKLAGSKKLRPGCYMVTTSTGALQLFRHIRNGQQSPIRLTINAVRTPENLAELLSQKLMMSKEEAIVSDSLFTYFLPQTYEVYWTISISQLLEKVQKNYKNFWNENRRQKAEGLGLTPLQVQTLASIVDEETNNTQEKPMVAGMYYNRYKINMPLQADPTIKYALGDFSIKRIYNNMLNVESPYNTYRNKGLPPGPIRMASVAGIDAVLNMVHHNYLYMCAKEDFSGTHNFAATYNEHLNNAAKYTKALNDRNIR